MKGRLGDTIRLELWLRDGAELSRAQELKLSTLGALHQSRPQHVLLRVPQARVGQTIDLVLAEIGADTVEDFRLATASLEDVYVEIVGRSLKDPESEEPAEAAEADRVVADRV